MEGTGVKVLIVDDNKKNIYMLEVLLKSSGYDVVTAETGIEALEKLHAGRFDGIVSDILMPQMDGFRLIRECKKDPILRQVPFIFYTATYTEKKDEEFGLSLGAIRYIIKPAEPEELLRQIRQAFLENAKSPRDFSVQPVPDEDSFSREYLLRVGAKLEKKSQMLAESEEKYRLLYDNSMDAILLTSPDGSIQAANPAACAMFQRTEEEMIKGGRNIIFDVTDNRLSAALEKRSRTAGFVGELTFLRKDGTRFAGEISSSIFTDRHGQTRSSMIIRDISERKRADERIRLANRKLALMRDVAYQDIQNKITALRGYIELGKKPIDEQQRTSFIEKEETVLRSIHDLIESTKDYQQMGVDQSCWVPMEKTIRIQFTHLSRKNDISLDCDLHGLEILADPLIDRVVFNLIQNAARHGGTISRISFSCREIPQGVVLVCEDDGIGVPPEEKTRIFERVAGGTGKFGLFFVREFLDIAGMRIAETGIPGKGARFEITIPAGMYRFRSENS